MALKEQSFAEAADVAFSNPPPIESVGYKGFLGMFWLFFKINHTLRKVTGGVTPINSEFTVRFPIKWF